MWAVLHHWQDDDYKGISSGVHGVWVCADRPAANACAFKVLRRLVRERVATDPTNLETWLKKTDRPVDSELDDDDLVDGLDDDDVCDLHEQLFRGEYIPGPTEWVEVMPVNASQS